MPISFAGLQAVAVGTVLRCASMLVDLANQLALAVAVRSSRLNSSACVGRSFGSGNWRLVLHVQHGAVDLDHQIALPVPQYACEVLELFPCSCTARRGEQYRASQLRGPAKRLAETDGSPSSSSFCAGRVGITSVACRILSERASPRRLDTARDRFGLGRRGLRALTCRPAGVAAADLGNCLVDFTGYLR